MIVIRWAKWVPDQHFKFILPMKPLLTSETLEFQKVNYLWNLFMVFLTFSTVFFNHNEAHFNTHLYFFERRQYSLVFELGL